MGKIVFSRFLGLDLSRVAYATKNDSRCYDNNGKRNGYYGPMDPSKQQTYNFIEDFFEEISQVFPEKYLHLGGDEVDFKCWYEIQSVFLDKSFFSGRATQRS